VYVRDTFRCGVLRLHPVKINVCEACPVTTKEERSLAHDIRHCLRRVPVARRVVPPADAFLPLAAPYQLHNTPSGLPATTLGTSCSDCHPTVIARGFIPARPLPSRAISRLVDCKNGVATPCHTALCSDLFLLCLPYLPCLPSVTTPYSRHRQPDRSRS